MKSFALLLALLAPLCASAGTLYKSVTPDGRIIYSDHPPEGARVDRTINYSYVPGAPPESAARPSETPRSAQTRPAAAKQPVLYMAKWCAYCRQAEAYLNANRISYQRHDIDTPEGKRAWADAGLSGGIPVLFVGNERVRGWSKQTYDRLFGKTLLELR